MKHLSVGKGFEFGVVGGHGCWCPSLRNRNEGVVPLRVGLAVLLVVN